MSTQNSAEFVPALPVMGVYFAFRKGFKCMFKVKCGIRHPSSAWKSFLATFGCMSANTICLELGTFFFLWMNYSYPQKAISSLPKQVMNSTLIWQIDSARKAFSDLDWH